MPRVDDGDQHHLIVIAFVPLAHSRGGIQDEGDLVEPASLKRICQKCKYILKIVVVVAQLAERSLPIPDIRGSNPVIKSISYKKVGR